MRLAILTTETTHHAYFVREIAPRVSVVQIISETESVTPKFETHHPFEDEREEYERDVLFGGDAVPRLDEFGPLLWTPSINSNDVAECLNKFNPDLVIDFGTRKLAPEIIDLIPDRIFNLHGGDPERYRGLDSHLWAIYHRDYAALVTTLHRLSPELDRGDVVLQGTIQLPGQGKIFQLRRFNTELCVQLVRTCIGMAEDAGITSRPQRTRGRYYSFMPAPLKQTCACRFNRDFHTSQRELLRSA